MEEQGFVLRDVDYDDRVVAIIRDIQNPYEFDCAQNLDKGYGYCWYNLQQQNHIEEIRY